MNNCKITAAEIAANNVKSAADYTSETNIQNNKNTFDRLPELIADKFNSFVDEVADEFENYYTKDCTDVLLENKVFESEAADMTKEEYGTDQTGVVKCAKEFDGHPIEYFATAAQMAEMMPKASFVFDADTGSLYITL